MVYSLLDFFCCWYLMLLTFTTWLDSGATSLASLRITKGPYRDMYAAQGIVSAMLQLLQCFPGYLQIDCKY